MPMTINDYLENPMGKGSSVIPNRRYIIESLKVRYLDLMKKKDFTPTIYKIKNVYYLHFLIPSESERENTYDVVIEFDPTEKALADNFISRYDMKVFSNCPSFTFTYAYVFNENDLMVKFLRNKYDRMVMSSAPSTRNPNEVISFEKSSYFACLYIKEHSNTMLNKIYLDHAALKTNQISLSSKIRTESQIMKEIEKEKNKLKADKEEKINELKKQVNTGSKKGTIKAINNLTNRNKVSPKKKIGGRSGRNKISGKKKIH